MTPEEHERERRAFWDACCIAVHVPSDPNRSTADLCAAIADAKLAERDKRWPGPAVNEIPPHVQRAMLQAYESGNAQRERIYSDADGTLRILREFPDVTMQNAAKGDDHD